MPARKRKVTKKTARKTTARKKAARKSPSRKTAPAKKPARKKTAGKKATPKKAAGKKSSRKKTTRRTKARRARKKAPSRRPVRLEAGPPPEPVEPEPRRLIHDISPPMSPEFAVFPGDTPISRQRLYDMALGHPLTLSALHASVHAGSHADAPSHYGISGRTIDQQPLDLYIGRCQVIEARWWPGQRISPQDIECEIVCERVLIKTGSWPDPTEFNPDYAALSPDAVHMLADRGVRLVGVDVPSVDTPDSKTLPSHGACLMRDLSIIECLDLSAITPGEYVLVALPLKLVGFDASPVRAVLLDM